MFDQTRHTFSASLEAFCAACVLASLIHPSSNAQTTETGDLVAMVQAVRDAMPGMGSNAFVVPHDTALDAFAEAIGGLQQRRLTDAAAIVGPYGYSVVRFMQTATTDTFLVLRENVPVRRGWGTYVFFPPSSLDLAVEVPHPIWDTRSWELGSRLYLRLRARWFSVSGTHRYANDDNSSDVAHVTQAVFHRFHTTVGASRAIQVHGFDKSKAEYAGYPDVVISNGTIVPSTDLYDLQTAYQAHGFTAGVFSASTASALGQLGATTNKQGQWSNAQGKRFVHIEHDYPLRTNFFQLLQVVEAVYEEYGSTTIVRDADGPPATATLNQNVPNPFNPATNISFSLTRPEPVTLVVFDLRGREVARLCEGVRGAGDHALVFNAAGLPSGMYLYRLQAHSWTETRSMLLLK